MKYFTKLLLGFFLITIIVFSSISCSNVIESTEHINKNKDNNTDSITVNNTNSDDINNNDVENSDNNVTPLESSNDQDNSSEEEPKSNENGKDSETKTETKNNVISLKDSNSKDNNSEEKPKSSENSKDSETKTESAKINRIECPLCKGSKKCGACVDGNCYRCSGTGESNCMICRGTNICGSCMGNGSENGYDCSLCGNGECNDCINGKIECFMCEGKKKCVACKGSMKCALCDGNGYFNSNSAIPDIETYELVDCGICDKTGKKCNKCTDGVCSNCGGKGYDKDCFSCHGTNKCSTCDGTGISPISGYICFICHNEKECTTANCVEGKHLCYYCRGKKICDSCYGTRECIQCQGNGKYVNYVKFNPPPAPEYDLCPICGKKAYYCKCFKSDIKIDCSHCGGKGTVDCSDRYCNNGNCSQCAGDGDYISTYLGTHQHIECTYCDNGRCNACGGDGEVDCRYC